MAVASDQRRPAGQPSGIESNARLTGSTAAILLFLLAAEGVTVLRIHSLLSPHVFIGTLLIPPVLLKIASTTWRFVRYYLGHPEYRRKGPPPWVLRLLGPAVVGLTVILFASGVTLLFSSGSLRSQLLFVHKASFILWLLVMTIHVLGHLQDTARLASRDWLGSARRRVAGRASRVGVLLASVGVGLLLGLVLVGRVGAYLTANPYLRFGH